jgi:hypothetical protein
MENKNLLMAAAGIVVLFALWNSCHGEHYSEFVEGFRGKKAAKGAGKTAGKAAKKTGHKKKKHHKDMSGLTFVCKAVDFGGMGGEDRHEERAKSKAAGKKAGKAAGKAAKASTRGVAQRTGPGPSAGKGKARQRQMEGRSRQSEDN